jgi:[protein-PII] uridylyltransferase
VEARTPQTGTPARAFQVKTYLDRHRGELLSMLGRKDVCGTALARRHAKVMDGLFSTLYPMACATTPGARTLPVLLGAVGGYGRELLGLKSDLDVKLLTTASPERVQPLAEAILYPLWDAGVSVGHQVVSVADAVGAAEDDLPTATALLDFRPLAGDPPVGRQLAQDAFAGPFCLERLPHFLNRLQAEVRERHRRFADSTYMLEPDVKNGAGGLRDLDVALWVGRAAFHAPGIAALSQGDVLVPREAQELENAAEFLWTLRNQLHHHAGRRNDRLTFDEQERIADQMGYRDRIGVLAGAGYETFVGPMVEAFMSDYFRHARVVERSRDQLLARAMPRPSKRSRREEDLGRGLLCLDGQLALGDVARLATDPALAMRLYATAVERNAAIAASTRDAVARAAVDPLFGTALRASPEAASLFVGLVCNPRIAPFRGGSILTELHDVGLLVAMIPEFATVVGRVHHDLYHVYPVDVHSIATVDRLRALCRGDLLEEHALGCRLALRIEQPEVLFLAALLHDVGKAIGSRGHARRGAEVTREVLGRLGFSREATQRACRLVSNHLLMYLVATRRDLGEMRVVVDFAHELDGRGMLRELYLLTIADLATTSPGAMTAWKARMLDELFSATDVMLAGIADGTAARITQVSAQVKQLWSQSSDEPFLDEFLATMPERYLLSNAPAEIAAHARVAFAMRAGGGQVSAKIVPSRHAGVAELCIVAGSEAGLLEEEGVAPNGAGLCVVAGDRPGLLAAVTAAIAASRLEIHAAQVHSRRLADGTVQAVDLFWVRDRAEGPVGVERALPKLERDLEQVILGEVSPQALVTQPARSRWSERPAPRVATEVVIDDRTSPQHTIVEVMTKDRPGLLYTIAQLMHDMGLTIATAKINTEGNRVVDVFYVTEADGTKLATRHRMDEVRARLLLVLAEPGKAQPASSPAMSSL